MTKLNTLVNQPLTDRCHRMASFSSAMPSCRNEADSRVDAYLIQSVFVSPTGSGLKKRCGVCTSQRGTSGTDSRASCNGTRFDMNIRSDY